MTAPSQGLFNPGEVFADKYTIERVLGEGGMGVVYRAMHKRLSQRVAIKTLLPAMLSRPQLVARFEREAKAAAQLRSRHAVRVIDVGELPNGLPFMVMEYLEGRDLADELAARGPLPVKEAVDWVLQACAAMAEAHDRGIVHRDIKPSNLFLAEEGGGTRTLKVLDFGISKFEEDAGGVALTATEASIGTPLYMSPEQVRSARGVDRRTDVWSIGVVLFELIVGRPPFGGGEQGAASVGASIVADDAPVLSALRPDAPKELDLVMQHALAKKRDERFADARALANALLPFSSTPEPRASSPFLVRPPDERMQSLPDAYRDPTLDVSGAGAITPPLVQTEAGFGQTLTPSQKRARVGVIGVAVLVLVGAGIVALRLHAPAPTQATVSETAHASDHAPLPPATSIAPLPTAAPEATLGAASASSAPVASPLPAASPVIAPAPRPSSAPARPHPSGSPARPSPSPSLANPTRL